MIIFPKTTEEAEKLIWDILIQGDTRYYDFEAQRILIWFLVGQGISLEERDLPDIPAPKEEDLQFYGANIQREEKYIARFLLFNQAGFKKEAVLCETAYSSFRPDVLAESKDKVVVVECCSCHIHKIKSYLEEGVQEVWVITYGVPPWDKDPMSLKIARSKTQWFIFKQGLNWKNCLNTYNQEISKELKEIKSPLDSL